MSLRLCLHSEFVNLGVLHWTCANLCVSLHTSLGFGLLHFKGIVLPVVVWASTANSTESTGNQSAICQQSLPIFSKPTETL